MTKFIRLFVALAALCILVLPAFSMPDNGMTKDGNCQKPLMGADNHCDCHKDIKSMSGETGRSNHCGCHKNIRSMMGKKGIHNHHHKHIGSMMGGLEWHNKGIN